MKVGLRRPASAVACAAGFMAGLAFARGDGATGTTGIEILVGGLLAVAAIGELPDGLLRTMFFQTVRPWPAEAVAWAATRSLFPLVGVAAAAAGFGREPLGSGLAAIMLAIVATAFTQAAVQAGGGRGSEPATAALLVASGAAGAAWAGLSPTWLAAGWASAAVAAGQFAGITTAKERLTCPRGRGRTVWLWSLPAQGRLRPSMTAVAMLVGLAAMAAWLVPQPPMANRYAAVAAAVFIAVASPQMTIADGVVDRAGWTAVLQPARNGTGWPPAGRIALGHLALFAWPLVVAGVLTLRLPGAAVATATAVALLILLAGLAAAIVACMQRGGFGAETTFAAMLAVFAVACAWCGPGLAEFPGLSPV